MPAQDGWRFTGRAVRGRPLYCHRNRATGVVRYKAKRDGDRWTPAFTTIGAVDRWLEFVGGCGPLGGSVRHLRGAAGRTYCGLDVDTVDTDAPSLIECAGCFTLYDREPAPTSRRGG